MNLKSINPHDQSMVGESRVSTKKEVENVVKAAKKAFVLWKRTSIEERINYIKKFRKLVVKNKKEIARLTTSEMGKPITQSLGDVDWEIEFLDYYIANGKRNLADETILKKGNEHFRIVYEPYGVCAVIAPWNFPLSMANSGITPALIAGNTVVFKPSEYTTLSQKKVAELLIETGLPRGVLNIVVGGSEVGSELIDQEINLVWFTGSSKVGREIYEKCGRKFIKALCEMGGSSPAIVFKDADLSSTAENLYWARFLNCGQVCTSVKRLFLQRPIFEEFLKMYIDRLKKIKLGNPMDSQIDIGPLVNKKQLIKLEEQVNNAVKKGAKVLVGGKRPKDKSLNKGNYFEPTILINVNSSMEVMHEEVFGPVLSVMPFDKEKEAIEMANRTEYGLSAEVYTRDIEKGERVAKAIEAGAVAINTDNFFKPECPFGGYKSSGVGREYGRIGMQEFAQIKTVGIVKP